MPMLPSRAGCWEEKGVVQAGGEGPQRPRQAPCGRRRRGAGAAAAASWTSSSATPASCARRSAQRRPTALSCSSRWRPQLLRVAALSVGALAGVAAVAAHFDTHDVAALSRRPGASGRQHCCQLGIDTFVLPPLSPAQSNFLSHFLLANALVRHTQQQRRQQQQRQHNRSSSSSGGGGEGATNCWRC